MKKYTKPMVAALHMSLSDKIANCGDSFLVGYPNVQVTLDVAEDEIVGSIPETVPEVSAS